MQKNLYNFLKNIPNASLDEVFETVIENKKIKIERIVSYGQTTPEDYWYDQDEDEFIFIVQGDAKIKYDDETVFELKTADSLYIPAHQKHRVIYTSDPVVWLAVFI